jgi:hypothetical protein
MGYYWRKTRSLHIEGEGEGEGVSQAIVIMISSLLRGLDRHVYNLLLHNLIDLKIVQYMKKFKRI